MISRWHYLYLDVYDKLTYGTDKIMYTCVCIIVSIHWSAFRLYMIITTPGPPLYIVLARF